MVNVLIESKSEWGHTQEDPKLGLFRSFTPPEDRAVFLYSIISSYLEDVAPSELRQLRNLYVHEAGCEWFDQWWLDQWWLDQWWLDLSKVDSPDPEEVIQEVVGAFPLPWQQAARRVWGCRRPARYHELAHYYFAQEGKEILEVASEEHKSKSLLERLNEAYSDEMEPEEREFLELAKESYRRQLAAEE